MLSRLLNVVVNLLKKIKIRVVLIEKQNIEFHLTFLATAVLVWIYGCIEFYDLKKYCLILITHEVQNFKFFSNIIFITSEKFTHSHTHFTFYILYILRCSFCTPPGYSPRD